MAMDEMECTNCEYRFTPKAAAPNACPYCAKRGTLQRVKKMQDWLDEAVVTKDDEN